MLRCLNFERYSKLANLGLKVVLRKVNYHNVGQLCTCSVFVDKTRLLFVADSVDVFRLDE